MCFVTVCSNVFCYSLHTVCSIGGGGLGGGGAVVVGGGTRAAGCGQYAAGGSSAVHDVQADDGRVTVKVPLGQATHVLDVADVFQGQVVQEEEEGGDTMPGGQGGQD